VCQRDQDCEPPPPPIEYDPLGNPLPQEEAPEEVDDEGRPLPPWRCIAYGALVPVRVPPVVSPGLEVVIATSNLGAARQEIAGGGGALYGDVVGVEPWSLAQAGLAGDELSRPPGINVGPSDVQLDQITHSPNAFSYARPRVTLVVPREGPVRRSRTITVDGSDFGIQSRYIEVLVTGIPRRLHALGKTLVATPGGGVPTGGEEEVCCSCDWYCYGYPRVCRCRDPTALARRRCVAGSRTSGGARPNCREYHIQTCGVTRVHQQLTCKVPDLHHELDEGLLPIRGALPKQKLSSAGDREFQLCSPPISGYDGPCPLSKVPGFYVGWEIKITFPVSGEYDIREVIGYEGQVEAESKTFLVVLSDALRSKPECDDQLGCPTYTLTPSVAPATNMPRVPTYQFYDAAHPFPGFCGAPQVRVRVDGMHIYINFDVQTTHARQYRSRPGLRSDVFKYDCNGRPSVGAPEEVDCEEILIAAAVADYDAHPDGEKLRDTLTSGIKAIEIDDEGWGCLCPTFARASTEQVLAVP
jgi:hypothetical protein